MVRNRRVLVGMSGGMDSSVAAAVLKESGFEVIGLTMDLYFKPYEPGKRCASDLWRAEEIAKQLGIEHILVDIRGIFKETVIASFSKAYLSGRTPNPCVTCNKAIKLRTLLQVADRIGADFIATGHYARIEKDRSGMFALKKALDHVKDQTYFLYRLGQQELRRTLFPLGEISGQKVIEMADMLGLQFGQIRSSQDICFIPDGDYARFLREEVGIEERAGPIVDKEGKLVGKHRGIHNYTIGQRKGVRISGGPYYVIEIDRRENKIVIGRSEDLYRRRFSCIEPSFIDGKFIEGSIRAKVKIRYQHRASWATIEPCEAQRLIVTFDEPQRAITPGQAAVFYTEDGIVIGGGTIDAVLE